LYKNEFANRVNFYNWMRQQPDLNPLFTYYLMFPDEALFTNTGEGIGQVNRHNLHYWSDITHPPLLDENNPH